jgi:hypothetical protein
MARVVVDSVRVREEPSTSGNGVGTLERDELVALGFSLVADWGPIEADGFSWYPVQALGRTDVPPVTEPLEGNQVYGWVAAGDDASPYLELVPPRCVEGEPDLALLQNLLPWEHLACYGDRSITFEATYGCGGCGGLFPGTFEPPWLTSPMNFHIVSVDPNVRVGPMAVRFSPDGPEPPEFASIVRITGHFDHPAAAGCTVAPGEPPSPIDSEVAELYCREQFVVDRYEVIGHDDDFLGG